MKIIKIIIAGAILSISAASTYAQDCDHTHRWWLNLAGGIGSTFGNGQENIDGDGAAQLSFNGMITEKLFMSLVLTGLGDDHDNGTRANEQALLLGYKSKEPKWYWSLSAGVGHLETSHRYTYYSYAPNLFGNYNSYYNSYTEDKDYFSVPVQGQLFWTPFKHVGIGLIGHASFGKKSMTTGLIGIQLS